MRSALTVVVMCLSSVLQGQPAQSMEELMREHPDQQAVLLNYQRDIRMEVKGNKPSIQVDHMMQVGILRVKDQMYRDEMIPYEPEFFELTSLSASTWVDENGSYRRLPVTQFLDVQQLGDDIFYDGHYYKKFVYPATKAGTVTECRYTYDVKDGVSIGTSRFRFPLTLVSGVVTVSTTDDVELGFSEYGDFSSVTYSTRRKGRYTEHRWEARKVPGTAKSDFTADDDRDVPRLFVFVKSYRTRDGRQAFLGSLDELYRYTYRFVDDLLNESPGPEAIAVVDSIRARATDERDIVKGVFGWVQDHVRYVAFEDGLGAFVPRRAEDVMRKRYGDCKDMANILYAMLRHAGLEACLAWVGTREIPQRCRDYPYPQSFNHMIAVYRPPGGEWIFLDATDDDLPFGMPSYGIQGKDVLICRDESNYELVNVPEADALLNRVTDHVSVRIEGNDLHASGRAVLAGYIRSLAAHRIMDAPDNDRDIQVYEILKRGTDKCRLTRYTLEGLEDRNQPLVMDYDIVIQDYVRRIGDELFVNLNFDRTNLRLRPDTLEREVPAVYTYRYADESVYTLSIPDGYEVGHLPDDLEISNEICSARYRYVLEGRIIRYEAEFRLNTLEVPLSRMSAWLESLDRIALHYRQVITLRKS